MMKTKILVISGYSDTFHIGVIGTTVFTNRDNKFENLDLDTNKIILKSFESGFNSVKFSSL